MSRLSAKVTQSHDGVGDVGWDGCWACGETDPRLISVETRHPVRLRCGCGAGIRPSRRLAARALAYR